MLRQLSSSHDTGQSIVIYHSCMQNAPSVVIASWQRIEHGNISLRHEWCSVICHWFMTKVRTFEYIIHVWNMLRQLPSSHDNGQSMVIYHSSMKDAPLVVIVSWQRSEYGNIIFINETWSISCHRFMTTDVAWLFIPKVWVMRRQLPLSHDNGQSMVIYHTSMKHAPSFVFASCQRTEHGYTFLRYETCFDSCRRLMTTVRAWWYIPHVWNMLWQLSSAHENLWSEHGYISLRYE